MLWRLLLAVLMFAVAAPAVVHAVEPETDTADSAVEYIKSLQNSDGGFPAFGTDSSAGSTIDAVFALVSAGVAPASVTDGGYSPADYLETQSATYSAEAGALAKLILCVRLMEMDVTSFGGINLLSEVDQHFDDGSGTFGDDNFDQALFVLSAETFEANPVASRPAAAAERLRSLQQADGGWEFVAGQGSDSNTTAMVLQALLARDWGWDTTNLTAEALTYLRSVQSDDGGFGFLLGADSDPNSTALVIQALVAAGEDIEVRGPWDRARGPPLDALMSYFNSDTGAFQYAGTDSAFATYQAVPALMLAPFPTLETVRGGPSSGTPTAVPDLPPVQPTPTPSMVLPITGSGPHDGSDVPRHVATSAGLVSAALACCVAAAAMRLQRGRR